MKPKLGIRKGRTVVVQMNRAKSLQINDDMRAPKSWEDNYPVESSEAVCLKWAATCGGRVSQLSADKDIVTFYFTFPTDQAAIDFFEAFETKCSV